MGDLTPGWKFGETRERASLLMAASLITHTPSLIVPNLDLLHTLYVCTWELCGLFFPCSFLPCATDMQTAAETLAV